jgi:hypothetical protein
MRPEAFEAAFDALLEAPGQPADEVLSFFRRGPEDETELEQIVTITAARASAMAGKPEEAVLRWGLGEILHHLLGRVDPAEAAARLALAMKPIGEGTTHVR